MVPPFESPSGLSDFPNGINGFLPEGWSVDGILTVFRYVYPSVVYVYFIGSTVISLLFLHSLKLSIAATPDLFRSPVLLRVMQLCPLTYFVQLCAIVLRSWYAAKWIAQDDEVVSIAACMILYSIQSLRISEDDFPVWYPYIGSWITGLCFEPILMALWFLSSTPPQLDSRFDVMSLSLFGIRVCFYLVTICSYSIHSYRHTEAPFDEEQQPLLSEPPSNSKVNKLSRNSSSYGSTTQVDSAGSSVAALPNNDSDSDSDSDNDEAGSEETSEERKERKEQESFQKKLLKEGNWFLYLRRYKVSLGHCIASPGGPSKAD